MSEKEPILIQAIISGLSVREAAVKADMTPQELRRCIETPGFSQRLHAERWKIVDRFRREVKDGSVEAVASLRQLLTSGAYQIRIAAAKVILDARQKIAQMDLEVEKLRPQEALPPKEEEEPAGRNGKMVEIDNNVPTEVALRLWREAREAKPSV